MAAAAAVPPVLAAVDTASAASANTGSAIAPAAPAIHTARMGIRQCISFRSEAGQAKCISISPEVVMYTCIDRGHVCTCTQSLMYVQTLGNVPPGCGCPRAFNPNVLQPGTSSYGLDRLSTDSIRTQQFIHYLFIRMVAQHKHRCKQTNVRVANKSACFYSSSTRALQLFSHENNCSVGSL
jgi:hypothetical protein